MVFEKIRDLIVSEFNVKPEQVQLTTHLVDDLGADSLDAVELIMAVEDKFDIEVDDQAAQNIKRVGDLVEYIEAHI